MPTPDYPRKQLGEQLSPYVTLSAEQAQALVPDLTIPQDQVTKGIREIANDGAVALTSTDSSIVIADSTTGNKAITTASSYAGQQVWIRLVAATGGSYTLALVAGTLTLNAANETAMVVRNAANDGWLAGALIGATIV